MEPGKEKWINDVLRSLDGLQRAEPRPFLFAKIRHRLSIESVVYVSPRAVWITAVSFALLLAVNWRVLKQPASSAITQATELNTVVTDMQLYPTDNQLYDHPWSGQNY